MHPTMTLEEANRRVDQHIEDAVAQMPGSPRLKEEGRGEAFPCDDPDDQGPLGRKIADRSYQVLGIKGEDIPRHFDTLKAWWLDHGFSVLDNKPKYEYLQVENKKDAVRLSLQAYDESRLYIAATPPCVWPDGTPEPDSE